MKDWITLEYQYNKELNQHEFLLVGEIDGKQKYAASCIKLGELENSENINGLCKFVSNGVGKFLSLRGSPGAPNT